MRIVRIIMVVFSILAAFVFGYTLYNRRVVDDKEAPVITADADSLMVSITATDEELLKGMKANDNLDGDITNTLVVLSKSKFISKGVLHANYAAFDSSKNVGTYTREITYVDYVSPRFSTMPSSSKTLCGTVFLIAEDTGQQITALSSVLRK